MTFLDSLLLWALPLAAVPVLLHLLNRRKREIVRWGAMMFLVEAIPQKRRIFRVNDLLLMILRTLAIVAVVLAFARPQVRSGLFSGTAPGRDVIVIADASLSTGRLVGGAPVFEQVRRKAAEVVERLNATDHVRLQLAAATPHWVGSAAPDETARKETILKQLAALKPTLGTADMAVGVQSALTAATPAEATSRLIVIVTDGAAHGWNVEAGARWQSIREMMSRASVPTAINVVAADAPKSALTNLSVEALTTARSRVAVGEPLTVSARVRNTGDIASKAETLKWQLNGQPAGESSVSPLSPGQSVDVSLETACDQPGIYTLAARLDRADDLPEDNSASIVLDSLERVPILICRSDADPDRAGAGTGAGPDFLRAALGSALEGSALDGTARDQSNSTVFEPTLIGIDSLSAGDFSRYRCVILDDVLPKSPQLVDSLADFVQKGGGLWVILGQNVTADQFNSLLFREGGGLSPVALKERVKAADVRGTGRAKNDRNAGRRGAESASAPSSPASRAEPAGGDRTEFFTIHPPGAGHPATSLLGDTERLDIGDVRINECWRLSKPEEAENVSVLLETGNGMPLAVERFAGTGRLIVQGLPMRTQWSNLPVCQVFVALVQEWTWYLTQPTSQNYNLEPGVPIVLSAEAGRQWKQGRLLTPIGQTQTATVAARAGRSELRFDDTAFPGIYQVTVTATDRPDQRFPFSVRRDPDESRLAPLSAEQKSILTQAGGVRFNVDPLSLLDGQSNTPRYQPFWTYLLALCALLLGVELFCANVLTKQRYPEISPTDEMVLAESNERPAPGQRSS